MVSSNLYGGKWCFFCKGKKKKKGQVQVHCDPAAETRFSYLCHLGSSFSVHVYHFRGVLPVYWACKVFSESEN
jgi:hypothetical protein